ncbi:unnamed protein product [Caenorhabditis sp. 36 PRJEB53466]|nr:unnamed protein product [Caenorhabditis sp. 36 PRJEB53466]
MTTPAVKMVVAYVTAPSRDVAMLLARTTVSESLAACANVIPGVTSVYKWQGKIEEDQEHVVILKTQESRISELETRVKSLHPAETPCFFTLAIDKISDDFGKWLNESTASTE